jgi:hypothetical protein
VSESGSGQLRNDLLEGKDAHLVRYMELAGTVEVQDSVEGSRMPIRNK